MVCSRVALSNDPNRVKLMECWVDGVLGSVDIPLGYLSMFPQPNPTYLDRGFFVFVVHEAQHDSHVVFLARHFVRLCGLAFFIFRLRHDGWKRAPPPLGVFLGSPTKRYHPVPVHRTCLRV